MLNECNWRHTCWNFWKRFGDWIHIFAPKPMTIVNFNFILCSMFIIKNWKASLVIFIGFGEKIWIQSPNLFQKFQQVWRQLHSLSIVDYPNFQCSRLFLGICLGMHKQFNVIVYSTKIIIAYCKAMHVLKYWNQCSLILVL